MDKATLTAERARELLDYDPETGVFTWKVDRGPKKAGELAGVVAPRGYIKIRVDWNLHQAHRLAWLLTHGEWPTEHIDHINGNPSDNRISNLRQATQAQNLQNTRRRRDNKSGFKGVGFHNRKGCWRSEIRINGRRTFLGYFACPTAAHIAYCKAAKEHFGEYARTD